MSDGKKEPTQVRFTGEEHRDSRRERRLKAAEVIFNKGKTVVDCVLATYRPPARESG